MSTSFKPSALPPAEKSSSISSQSWTTAVWPIGLGLILLGLGAYAAWPRVDDKALLDQQIEEGWMNGRETVDALQFFENGGIYENRDAPGTTDIDQNYVIPLVKQLRDKHRLEVLVVMHDKIPNAAMAVIVEAPADRQSRNEVRQTILELTDFFPGLATQNWSHRWVSLDFFDEEEAVVFHNAGAFEKLKESQRRME